MLYLHHRLRYSLVALLVLCGLAVSPLIVKAGANAVKLVVKDPKSGVEFEVTDPSLLGFMAFADLGQPLPEAPTVSDGYEITRYWSNGPFDSFHYYPGTGNTPGYIYYDGFIQGWSDSDRKWYQTPNETDQAMRQILGIHGLIPKSTARPLPATLLTALGAAVVLIILMAMGIRRSPIWRNLIRRPAP
jgi:hypothetical protein